MKTIRKHGKQSGAALAICLIILLVLTLLVMSGTQDVVLQERMTSSIRDANVSLSVAEAGILDAETFLRGIVGTNIFVAAGTGGLYSIDNGPSDFFDPSVWSNSANVRTATTAVSGLTSQYIVIYLGEVTLDDELVFDELELGGYGEAPEQPKANLFQIVSRATGRSGNAERLVVTYFGRIM